MLLFNLRTLVDRPTRTEMRTEKFSHYTNISKNIPMVTVVDQPSMNVRSCFILCLYVHKCDTSPTAKLHYNYLLKYLFI